MLTGLDTVTVTHKGQAVLPLAWRKQFGLENGGPCDARLLEDGKGSLLLTPRQKPKRGVAGEKLLEHLKKQTVAFPPIPRHTLPSR